MTPLVTVCIATYNRVDLLSRTVDSVLRQTWKNLELIIVDDYSTDGTPEWVAKQQLTDQRIRYIRHEQNKGLAAARNTAIFNAQGKYFSFVDDDDIWFPEYLDEFIKIAEQYDENWCFCCGSLTEDLTGQKVFGRYDGLEGKLLDYILAGYTPPITSQFYFTQTLQRIGGYNEQVKSGVDHDLWLSLAFKGVFLKSVDLYLAKATEPIDFRRAKMTNVYDKRLSGIQNSLSIWKSPIISHLGQSFYESFREAYLLREKKKFFRIYMLSFDIKKAFNLYKEIKKDLSIKEILKAIAIAVIVRTSLRIKRKKYILRKGGLVLPALKTV